jgi:site-specific DNA-methyltransferase (cytosine-N4-specific)
MTSAVAIRPKERDNTGRQTMASSTATKQRQKDFPRPHPAKILKRAPYFVSEHGAAFLGDSLELLRSLPSGQVNLVVTSPPYALHFKKEYGNKNKKEYIKWFLPFASEIHRVLRDDGSFVLNIGGSYNQGTPTRSIYHFKLLVALVEEIGFHLAQECFWYNPAKMPMPAEWVTVRRIRVRDSVEYVWWLSKTPWPKASNLAVLKEYSEDMIRLNRNGVRGTVRPSGHVIRHSFDKIDAGGSIPANVTEAAFDGVPESMLKMGNNAANDTYTRYCKERGIKIHPARFPALLPKFFIKLLTEPNDLVIDPFAGSNTTGAVAESLRRRWIACEAVEEYLKASTFRFEEVETQSDPVQVKLFE